MRNNALTGILGLTTIVTLYQAGNGIYDLCDKLLLLEGGKVVFYDPLKEALKAFGFVCVRVPTLLTTSAVFSCRLSA